MTDQTQALAALDSPLEVHNAHQLNRMERGRPLSDAEVACYLADHQTPIRHGTATIGDEIAEMLRDRLASGVHVGDEWLREALNMALNQWRAYADETRGPGREWPYIAEPSDPENAGDDEAALFAQCRTALAPDGKPTPNDAKVSREGLRDRIIAALPLYSFMRRDDAPAYPGDGYKVGVIADRVIAALAAPRAEAAPLDVERWRAALEIIAAPPVQGAHDAISITARSIARVALKSVAPSAQAVEHFDLVCACGHPHVVSVGDNEDAGCDRLGHGCDCWVWHALAPKEATR